MWYVDAELDTNQFSRDIPTRWNSTYELLNDSNDYKELLCDQYYSYKFIFSAMGCMQKYFGYLKSF